MPKEETAIAHRIDVGALMQQAIENKSSVETMERLFTLAKEVQAERARAAWYRAMADFQAEAPELVKSKTARVQTRSGGTYSYQYAPLQDLISAVRPILARHGLSAVFQTDVNEKRVLARCLVAHSEGHVQSCEFSVPIDLSERMNPAQQVASASTYARRYAYLSALGLAPDDDDDGEAAGDRREMATRRPGPIPEPQTTRADELFTEEPSNGKPFLEGVIVAVEPKDGKTGDRPWTVYKVTLDNGGYASTFDSQLADVASSYRQSAEVVRLTYKQEPKGKKLLGILSVS